MPTNYITLPRSELYELVWTRPVTELAKEFGISDVALAKRCRALNIPLPPRGYWAKVAAGQSPPTSSVAAVPSRRAKVEWSEHAPGATVTRQDAESEHPRTDLLRVRGSIPTAGQAATTSNRR